MPAQAGVENRRDMDDSPERREVVEDGDLEQEEATELPDRNAMSLIDPGSVTGSVPPWQVPLPAGAPPTVHIQPIN
jgi:hypothetical protein